jgi:hypothetical protein
MQHPAESLPVTDMFIQHNYESKYLKNVRYCVARQNAVLSVSKTCHNSENSEHRPYSVCFVWISHQIAITALTGHCGDSVARWS